MYAAFVDSSDPTNTAPIATVTSYSTALINPGGGKTEVIECTINIGGGLKAGQTVAIEVWPVLDSVVPPAGLPNDVVQAELSVTPKMTVPLHCKDNRHTSCDYNKDCNSSNLF